jgi:hypothetical protein
MDDLHKLSLFAPLIKLMKVVVKKKMIICVSKIEMSPITAKLKCPHGRGKDIRESKAVTEV